MKKRADGRYQRAITIDGKKEFFYGKTPAEVNKKILAYEKKREQGATFKQVAEEWYDSVVDTISPTTNNSYKANKNQLIDTFGHKFIRSIEPTEINDYLVSLKSKKFAYKTVLSKLQTIRQIFDFANLKGYANDNPANIVKMPKGLSKTKREVPTEMDIIKIKNSFGNTFSLFALTALYTGCRRGEILALTWKDIDFANRVIYINKSLYFESNAPHIKKPKTEAGIRKIPLLKPLEDIYIKIGAKKSGNIFVNAEGKLLTHRNMISGWKCYCKETGINITAHQLRHAYATRLYELNIDEKSAQGMLGHADISTTRNIYTHIRDEKFKTTAEQLKDF